VTFLTEAERDAVHAASLTVLEKAGVKVNNSQAIELLRDNGCTVDGDIVHIPPSLAEESIGKAPPSFDLYTREAETSYNVGGDTVIYNPGSSAIYFTDRETGEMRTPRAPPWSPTTSPTASPTSTGSTSYSGTRPSP